MCNPPDIPKQEAPAPAPPAPEESPSAPEITEGGGRSNDSKRRETSSLRIKLNSGTNFSSRGSGLNIPQG